MKSPRISVFKLGQIEETARRYQPDAMISIGPAPDPKQMLLGMAAGVPVANGATRWVEVAIGVPLDMLFNSPPDTTAYYLLTAWRAARTREVPRAR